jgi:hypothetical protein
MALSHRRLVSAGLLAGLLACPPAAAQRPPPGDWRLAGMVPGGARGSVTESWGTFDFTLTNRSDADRLARVLVFFGGHPDVQYGRDLWVPARSTLSSWLLAGPAAPQPKGLFPHSREVQVLLYERGEDPGRLVLPPTEERIRSRVVLYRKREPSATILLDPPDLSPPPDGEVPRPESPDDESTRLVRVFRHTREMSGYVPQVLPGPLPIIPEAFEGIDQFVIASNRIATDAPGLRALRRWVERGGKVWVMLDRVDLEAIAPLLGDALDFEVVDRVGLTHFAVAGPPGTPAVEQAHERPVSFARVLLPAGEQAPHTVNGWPAWFTRQVGRGRVVVTTLGPRGWYRPRTRRDPPTRDEHHARLPVERAPFLAVADQLQLPPVKSFAVKSFQQSLAEEIGYAIVPRRTVALLFAAFLVAVVASGVAVRRSRRPELAGWLAPGAALLTSAAILALAGWSRSDAPATVATGQLVDAVTGVPEAAVHGLLAVHRPEGGPLEPAAEDGGLFDLDMAGSEGQARRLILTDVGAWHWENLHLPAGVRLASFRGTVATGEPLAAVGHLGPEGIEGHLSAGPFEGCTDALISPPAGRNLAVRLRPDGDFHAGGQDVLAPGQFLAGTLLSDRQQRRQELYREVLKYPLGARRPGELFLLAWARPIDLGFRLAPEARGAGMALLRVPLRLERPAPGTRVTIPGPLVACRRLRDGRQTGLTLESGEPADMDLRFQVPAAALPLEVERARLIAHVEAPGRRLTVSGQQGGKRVEVHRIDSPHDALQVDLPPALLQQDPEGGLHVHIALGEDAASGDAKHHSEKWTIRYIEMEVSGVVGR